MYSMTGFAAKTITIIGENNEKAQISISIKSLNSRFFDTTFKIHYALSSLEHQIIEYAKEILQRGHIYCTIHVSNSNVFIQSIQPALSIVQSYCAAIELIKETCNIQQPILLEHIVRLPDVFSTSEPSISQQGIATILASIKELLQQVQEMRRQEGAALQKDLENRIEHMQYGIKAIEHSSAAVMEKQKQKIVDSLKEIKADETLLAMGQKNALYSMLDKMDINEEIVRFKSHLANISSYMKSDALEKGKRIDFTLQEVAREINTISAKCVDSIISEHVINIKVEIEKAREQAQNLV